MTLVIVYQIYQLMQSRNEMKAAFFELERDLMRRRQAGAVTMIMLAIEFCILLLGIQLQAVPFLEGERTLDEKIQAQQAIRPTDGIFVTDTRPAVAQVGLDIEVPQDFNVDPDTGFVPTPTLTPTPVGTIVANPPDIEGCIDDRANLEIPANGMRVFNPITVRGTAFADNFSSAKLEIEGPSTNGHYVVVDTITTPILDMSIFSQFLPGTYEPGLYQFRLTVFDITNTLVASCMVNIYISELPETLTPTPRAGG